MTEIIETITLEVIPIPPDTIASAKQDLVPLIERTLREAGRDNLLSDQDITIEFEMAFPTDTAIVVALTFACAMALETYKELILPLLKKRFQVKQKTRRKGKAKKGSK